MVTSAILPMYCCQIVLFGYFFPLSFRFETFAPLFSLRLVYSLNFTLFFSDLGKFPITMPSLGNNEKITKNETTKKNNSLHFSFNETDFRCDFSPLTLFFSFSFYLFGSFNYAWIFFQQSIVILMK